MLDHMLVWHVRATGSFFLLALLGAVLFLAWPATASAQEPTRNPAVILSFAKVDPNPRTHPQPADKVDGEFDVHISFNIGVTGLTADDFKVDHGSASNLRIGDGGRYVTIGT